MKADTLTNLPDDIKCEAETMLEHSILMALRNYSLLTGVNIDEVTVNVGLAIGPDGKQFPETVDCYLNSAGEE